MIERQFAPATQYIIGIDRLARIQPFVEQTGRIFIVRRGGRGAGGHRQAGGGGAAGGGRRRIQQRGMRRLVVVVLWWQTNVMRLDDEVLRLERILAVVVVVVVMMMMMMMGWMIMMMMIATRLSMVRVMIHSLCPTHPHRPAPVQLQQHTIIGGHFPRQNKHATEPYLKQARFFFDALPYS
jgi:hypothetical protein